MSQPATCDLSIIIVNWNTRELLAECLQSVISSQSSVTDNCQLTTETFVVDNASTDGSAAMVRERFPWVRLIESQENLGFAAGNNTALRQARSDYILLLNPDAVVTDGAIRRLWQVLAARPTAGAAGAHLLNADGSTQMSIGVFPSLWSELPVVNRRLQAVHGSLQAATPNGTLAVQTVDWVSGACLMIKREVVAAIGLLDENFWLYTEETDWCYRAHTAGWDIVIVPEAQVYHLARAASRQRFVITMLYFYQSRVRFIRKHHGDQQADRVRQLYLVKAWFWQIRPHTSPLAHAYPSLSPTEIRPAYRQLQDAMSRSLDSLLAHRW